MNAEISIVLEQGIEGGPSEKTEVSTEGEYNLLPDGYGVEYRETEASGMGDTVTAVGIFPEFVTLERKGDVSFFMEFKKGDHARIPYETSFGTILLDTCVRHLDKSFDDRGGRLFLDYTINIQGELINKNKLTMNVKCV